MVWSRKTGKPLSRAIVWDDSRTRGVVAHYAHLLKTQGIKVNGQVRSGSDGAEGLKELLGIYLEFDPCDVADQFGLYGVGLASRFPRISPRSSYDG